MPEKRKIWADQAICNDLIELQLGFNAAIYEALNKEIGDYHKGIAYKLPLQRFRDRSFATTNHKIDRVGKQRRTAASSRSADVITERLS